MGRGSAENEVCEDGDEEEMVRYWEDYKEENKDGRGRKNNEK